MSYTPTSDAFRVVSVLHGSYSFPDVVDWSYDEECPVAESRPGTRLSPSVVLDGYGLKAMVKTSQRFVPVTAGTKASLVITVLLFDGTTTGTITLPNMMALDGHGSGSSKPNNHEQHFVYDAGNVENISPISIT
jgi:hypothetical protein